MKQSIVRRLVWLTFLVTISHSLTVGATDNKEKPKSDIAQSVIVYRVVGLTSATTTGYAEVRRASGAVLTGLAALTAMCQEVAPNARPATDKEWAFTSHTLRTTPATQAWVTHEDPMVLHRPDVNDDNRDWVYLSRYAVAAGPVGATAPELAIWKATCTQFLVADNNGTTIVGDPDGFVRYASCDTELPVACSAAVSIPVTQ